MLNAKKVMKKINETIKTKKLREGMSAAGEKIARSYMDRYKTDYKAAANFFKSQGGYEQAVMSLNDSIWRTSSSPSLKDLNLWFKNVKKAL